MTACSFISGRLSFKGRAAVASIAVSIVVIIIATAVSAGFRQEITSKLRELSGDMQITRYNRSERPEPVDIDSSVVSSILQVEGVARVVPVVYYAGIVRREGTVQGVVFKGVETSDSASLDVRIPTRLSELFGLGAGDRITSFFVGENIVPRNFNVSGIYDSIVTEEDKMVVFCDIHSLRRVLGWTSDQCSLLEVNMEEGTDEADARIAEAEISDILFRNSDEDSVPLYCERTMAKYSQLFDWLHLIDANVSFILVLMIVVAAVNMISGLLILLFEHMSTIGLLKALGMTDAGIAGTFLLVSARLAGIGMAIGTFIGLGFCLLQSRTHLLRLNPVNYFVNFVPVRVDAATVFLYELIAFTAIMLVLLIPCKFISKVDPAKSVREN